jgi:hypothetical protein
MGMGEIPSSCQTYKSLSKGQDFAYDGPILTDLYCKETQPVDKLTLDMTDLARRGASELLRELDARREAILHAFPDLAVTEQATPAKATANDPPLKRRRTRRRMSKAERRAVSKRMKQYWASRGAAQRRKKEEANILK